ncbi:GNAT family N-acetyltransferase [Streptomyces sp. NPDC048172]|uniref:GNAT family N-acetyltransferase n=1 Tax=Streptomyces sp. NPDC048172 TaxID=3365505 RepID=UPI00371CE313
MRTEPIRTRRLDLLPLRVAHAAEMADVLSDPVLYAFIGGAPPGEEELRARYVRLTAGAPDPEVTWCNWVLQLRATTALVGTVQATLTSAPDRTPTAEIAWIVGAPWQGRGLAVEAARALVAALDAAGVRTVLAHVHPDHHASAAVAAAAGLRPTDAWQDGEVRWSRVRPG